MTIPIRGRTISVIALIALVPLGLILTGCTKWARAKSNRSLWLAELPDDPAFKGVTFILDDLRSGEFAFILARQFPESFVVARPARAYRHAISFYRREETLIPATLAPPGSDRQALLKLTESAGTNEAKVTNVPPPVIRFLPSFVVFHQMRMTACDDLPFDLSYRSSVRMTWSEEDYSAAPLGNQFLDCVMILPALLTLGSVFPIPMKTYPSEAVRLDLLIDSDRSVVIQADRESDCGVFYGCFWSPLISPKHEDVRETFLSEGMGSYSRGGWTDCLETMLADPVVRNVAAEVTPEQVALRQNWFDQSYSKEGFVLLDIPSKKTERGICVLRDALQPEAVYLWEGRTESLERSVYSHNCLQLIRH